MNAQRSGSLNGLVLVDGAIQPAAVEWQDGVVTRVRAAEESGGLLVLPGFVDLHCHGGGGADVMEGGDAARRVARAHARHGTAAFLATTMTAPVGDIEVALDGVASAMAMQDPDEARILGVHLEGPFISPDQLGAQPPFAIPASIPLLERFCRLAPIRVVTLAPEADPDGSCSDWLRARGILVQIGHTAADLTTTSEFLRLHADGVTHLFNAMGPFHQRRSGAVGAALAHADWAELISDGLHVDEGAALAALRAVPGLYAVTDATAAAGMPDGTYRLGLQVVHRKGDSVRLGSGGLAGSCLTMDGALRTLLHWGLKPADASRRTATLAAERLSLRNYGTIGEGKAACLVACTQNGEVREVVSHGVKLVG